MQNDSERGDHVHALAREMAGPVAKGWLHPCLAYAALAVRTDEAKQRGLPHDQREFLRGAAWTLRTYTAQHDRQRALTELQVARTVRPMIERRAPRNAVLAQAHNRNGEAGFPLTEEEVERITISEVWRALDKGARA